MLTDLISGICVLAKTIYTQANLRSDNKKQCEELSARLIRIEFSVKDLLTDSSDPDRYKVLLEPLEECLQECFEFLNTLNPAAASQSNIKKLLMNLKSFGKAKSHHEKFDQLYGKLGRIEADLTLALQSRTIHYLREARKHQIASDNGSKSAALSPTLPPSSQETKSMKETSEKEASEKGTSMAKDVIAASPSAYSPPVVMLYQSASKTSSPLSGALASGIPSQSGAGVSEPRLPDGPDALSYALPSQTLYKTDAATAISRPDSPGQESLKEKALSGDSDAQNNLGDCYYHGKVVVQNYDKAFSWFSKAAAKGHTVAQFNLGNCFYRGHGTPQSYPLAVLWYTRAAEAGDKDAQNNLGNCFKKGRTGAPDPVKAREWFRMAASQDHMEAQFNYAVCLHNGEGGPRDEKAAAAWYRKAADQGSATAKAYLGFCYEKGQGVAVDLKLAFDYYQQAAEAGDQFGKERLQKLQTRQAGSAAQKVKV